MSRLSIGSFQYQNSNCRVPWTLKSKLFHTWQFLWQMMKRTKMVIPDLVPEHYRNGPLIHVAQWKTEWVLTYGHNELSKLLILSDLIPAFRYSGLPVNIRFMTNLSGTINRWGTQETQAKSVHNSLSRAVYTVFAKHLPNDSKRFTRFGWKY